MSVKRAPSRRAVPGPPSVIQLHPEMGPRERARWIAFRVAGLTLAQREALRDHVVQTGYPVAIFDNTVEDILDMREPAV